ncbi:phenylalanine--tRNA ligase subunit beta-related protein, partial [Staphylococcus epidermidis]|uniref:phenylalanine--tRNA ligase subunit beta-related protein n=1 Tax=Staphylococcus epidermidis TaxID=1282 RepID=UPI0011A3F2D9
YILNHTRVFHLYHAQHLQKPKKSIPITLTYLHTQNTLTHQPLNALHDKILQPLKNHPPIIT